MTPRTAPAQINQYPVNLLLPHREVAHREPFRLEYSSPSQLSAIVSVADPSSHEIRPEPGRRRSAARGDRMRQGYTGQPAEDGQAKTAEASRAADEQINRIPGKARLIALVEIRSDCL